MDRAKYCRSKSYHILILFSRLSQSEGLVFFQNGHAAHRAELCSANSHKEVTVGSQKLFLSCLQVVSKLWGDSVYVQKIYNEWIVQIRSKCWEIFQKRSNGWRLQYLFNFCAFNWVSYGRENVTSELILYSSIWCQKASCLNSQLCAFNS